MALEIDSLMNESNIFIKTKLYHLMDLKPEVLEWLEEHVSPVTAVANYPVSVFWHLNCYQSDMWRISSAPTGWNISLIRFTDPVHELQFKLTWL